MVVESQSDRCRELAALPRPDSQRAILRRMTQMMQQMLRQPHIDAAQALQELTQTSVQLMPGADYGSVSVFSRRGSIEATTSTHAYVSRLDGIERRCDQGPRLSAARRDNTIRIDDLAADGCWPQFRDEAINTAPIRSLLSYSMMAEALPHRTRGGFWPSQAALSRFQCPVAELARRPVDAEHLAR